MIYQFEPRNIFLIKLEFSREPELPENLQLEIQAQGKVFWDAYPTRFQAKMRIRTTPSAPFSFKMEAVGLFDYTGTDPEEGKKLIPEYLNNYGFPLLWSSYLPVIKGIAANMDINALTLPLISRFSLDPKELLNLAEPPTESNKE